MVADVAAQVRWVIKAVVAGTPDAARADRFGTDLILVDAATPGSGSVFDWALIDELPDRPALHPGRRPDARQRRRRPSRGRCRGASTCRPASSGRRAARTR